MMTFNYWIEPGEIRKMPDFTTGLLLYYILYYLRIQQSSATTSSIFSLPTLNEKMHSLL